MSDFAKATSVSGSAGRYSATLDGDFCVWSPAGGYLMMLALRAAGAEASFPTPLSLACHFLSAPKLSEVALQVVSLRKSRVAESLRVCMLQDDRPVLEMLVWAGEPLPGYAHQDAHMPQVPSWQGLPAHAYPAGVPGFQSFWQHLEQRPCGPLHFQRAAPGAPRQRDWVRLRGYAHAGDAFLEAGRYALLLDSFTWPAAAHAHAGDARFIAPTVSFAVEFHQASDSEWLLSDAHSPHAGDGRIGIHNLLWSPSGVLVASASGTLICRPRPQR
jgi:acyl-CoA thioesterase